MCVKALFQILVPLVTAPVLSLGDRLMIFGDELIYLIVRSISTVDMVVSSSVRKSEDKILEIFGKIMFLIHNSVVDVEFCTPIFAIA